MKKVLLIVTIVIVIVIAALLIFRNHLLYQCADLTVLEPIKGKCFCLAPFLFIFFSNSPYIMYPGINPARFSIGYFQERA